MYPRAAVPVLATLALSTLACGANQTQLSGPAPGTVGSALGCLRDHAAQLGYQVQRADPAGGVLEASRQVKHIALLGVDEYSVIRASASDSAGATRLSVTGWLADSPTGAPDPGATKTGQAGKDARKLLAACSAGST